MRITDFIYHKIVGTITPDEQQLLDAWLQEDEQHKKMYDHLLNQGNIPSQYYIYNKLDIDRQWSELMNDGIHDVSISQKKNWNTLRSMTIIIVGLAAMILLVFGISRLIERPAAVPPTPVALSKAVIKAIERSEQTGRCEATVTTQNSTMTINSYADSILTAFMKHGTADCRISTVKGKEFWMTLPDGTRVHLDSNTKLAYTYTFGHDNRTVYLQGTAFFYVKKNADLPFIVKTDNGDVKEYGTEFNVEASPNRTAVVLVSGSIGLLPKGGGEKRLRPGYRGDMGSQGETRISPCDVNPYIAWNEGRFSFDNTTLKELMDVLARWYGVNVHFNEESLEEKRMTGILSRYDDINSSLKAIAVVAQVKVQVRKNTIYISK